MPSASSRAQTTARPDRGRVRERHHLSSGECLGRDRDVASCWLGPAEGLALGGSAEGSGRQRAVFRRTGSSTRSCRRTRPRPQGAGCESCPQDACDSPKVPRRLRRFGQPSAGSNTHSKVDTLIFHWAGPDLYQKRKLPIWKLPLPAPGALFLRCLSPAIPSRGGCL